MGLGVLEGRSALIPGARRGIGRAIALAFAREGADVAINHHPPADAKFPEAADEVAREVRSLGRRAPLIAADAAQEGAVQAVGDRGREEVGRVGIPGNNARVVTPSRTATT